MKLSIYSLNKTLFSEEAEKIIARTTTGEITVLDEHLPLISSLVSSDLEIIDEKGKKDKIKITSGFLEVRPESEVVILADTP